jgi:hypothetical protein
MAMGSKSRREAENAIASCRPFQNSTGSFYGTRGSTRQLGWLDTKLSRTEAARVRKLLRRAVYVVWSYNTPIAFVSEEESGERTAYYVDVSHSRTTSNHQSIARMGMGEYETIWENRPARRPRRDVPVDRTVVARLNARTAGYAEAAHREPTAAHVYAATARAVPADSPGYQNGRSETEQEQTLRRLLDPRYTNPDWVPDRDWEADRQAELRDAERVAREGTWRP